MPTPTSELLRSLRTLPRAAWILCLGTFLNKFGAFVVPFLTIYLRNRGFTDGQAGLALSAYGVGHLAASIVGGYLSDRIGRRKTIVLSMFSSAVSMLLLSRAENFPVIVVLMILTGLTAELYRPASSALLTDIVPPEQRVAAFAAYRWALNAGFAFGPATAGFLSQYNFVYLFVGDAITSLLFGLVAWFMLPHGVRSSAVTAKWSVALRVMREDRRLHRLLLAQFAIALVFLQMFSTFGLHVTESGHSARTYGLILSLNGLLVVLCELPLVAFTQRLPAHRIIAAGYGLVGLTFCCLHFAHSLPWLLLIMGIFTLGEMISMPVASAYLAEEVPAEMRGRYMGVYGLMWALGLTFGPSFGVPLHGSHPLLLWGGCAGLAGLAAALVLSSSRLPGAPARVAAGDPV